MAFVSINVKSPLLVVEYIKAMKRELQVHHAVAIKDRKLALSCNYVFFLVFQRFGPYHNIRESIIIFLSFNVN